MTVTRTKVRAPTELWGNLVAHLWTIYLMGCNAVEVVLVVDGVPNVSRRVGVRAGIVKNASLQSGEPEYPSKLILNLVPTNKTSAPSGPVDLYGSPMLLLYVTAPLVLDAVCDIRATSGWHFGRKEPGAEVYVASVTVAMGWISATGIYQRLQQTMLRTWFAGDATLCHEGKWRRDRPNPFTVKVCGARAWQVYIGNVELQEILPRSEAEQLRGTISKDPRAVMMADD